MRSLLKSRRFWLLPVALAMACVTWAVAALFREDDGVEDVYNRWLHNALVERQATGIQDLAERFLRDQESYLWIAPPDPDFILFQPGETIAILDLKAFPASFIDSLAGEIGADGAVRFPVWIYEDADSPGREIVIESLEQKVIARIGRDRDYSPEWFVRALYPALDTYGEWDRDWLTACYDPARVCMRYDLLVGEDNLIEYVWARSIEAARLAGEREAAAMMRSGESGSVSNLQFTAIGATTNGTIGLTLAWPDEGLGTNVVDIFACTDLRAGDWVLADTLTLDMQTNRVVWADADSTNHTTRFYDAWTHHDSDGDGIPDGREVRLYGTDRHQWDSDGDGLSDFAEIFVHGTSALNADSDGDGLPDGWEVQYGLDPLDATGDNGADGDPDGDGFTNLQEFQMGGDPANPAINAAQLIHRLMHCRGDSSLRVDVEDSANCGGTNPNRQEVEDVFNVGPLMHCGYLLSLSVEGRVEDHNSGFDKVSVRAYTATELQSEVPFFEGHNNGNGCAMVDEQATTNVWFWSNGSVRLRYDTVDGLYHTDAYAEITAAAFVDVLKVDNIRFQKSTMVPNWKTVDQVYKHLGVFTGQSATFGVNTTPSGITLPDGLLTWGGLASGTAPEANVTFSTPNFLEVVSVTCGGKTKTALVAIRDQPSGIGETAYAALHAVYTAIAMANNLIGTDATTLEPFIWANSTYPGIQHNTVADAARHAYWMCLLTRYTVAGYAEGLSTQHEVSSPGPSTETVMDLHNNLIGISIAGGHTHTSGLACCRSAVQGAVSEGDLWYLDSSYGAVNTAEDALLQPTNK